MKVAEFPFATLDCAPTSGAGPASTSCMRAATRGAAPAFNWSFGRAGAWAESTRGMSPGLSAISGASGAGAPATVAARRSRGRSFARASWLICKRGRAGPGDCWNCTIFGRFGRIFGGSSGAAELIKVCRGCVGRTGSVKMRCRGWKASAPAGGSGFSGSPRGLGLGFGPFISSNGRSSIGPDQVSCVLSKAE